MITNRNYNKGRRFLNPLEIEAQYITEDRANNVDLILWYDFTDSAYNKSSASGGASDVTNGDTISISQNKSYYTYGGFVSAGEKALGSLVAQTDSSKAPTWVDPGGGLPPYALFSSGDFLTGVGSLGRVSANNFSTSEIETNKFTAYIVCERDDPSVAGSRQDVLFVTTNNHVGTTPVDYFSFYYSSNPSVVNHATMEMYDAALSVGDRYRYVQYDTADDKEFHYHMFNAYEKWSNQDNYGSLQADGLFHQFSEPSGLPSPAYQKLANPGYSMLNGESGTFTRTFQFTGTPGTYHPSVTIGGQPVLAGTSPASGVFVGKIYEILIFKSEHAGGNQVDATGFGRPLKRRWSNMLYYLQRKYQHISVKI